MALKYTRDQVRDREGAQLGTIGRPNSWWAWSTGSDCMAAQATMLGLRTSKSDSTGYLISIAKFRAHYGWDEVDISEAEAGDLLLEYWPESDHDPTFSDLPNHIEYIYSINHAAGTVVVRSANTGPAPGKPSPNGFWGKTRPITKNLIRAIRVPYADAADTAPYGAKAPTSLAKTNVKLVAGFVNEWADRKNLDLHSTTSVKDGIPGPNYWRLVQTWGRQNGVYGSGYLIDGIVGPRTRQVEAIILKRAKAAKK